MSPNSLEVLTEKMEAREAITSEDVTEAENALPSVDQKKDAPLLAKLQKQIDLFTGSQDVKAHLQTLRGKIEERTRASADFVRANVPTNSAEMQDAARNAADEVKNFAHDIVTNPTEAVSKYPIKSALVTGIVGVAAFSLARRIIGVQKDSFGGKVLQFLGISALAWFLYKKFGGTGGGTGGGKGPGTGPGEGAGAGSSAKGTGKAEKFTPPAEAKPSQPKEEPAKPAESHLPGGESPREARETADPVELRVRVLSSFTEPRRQGDKAFLLEADGQTYTLDDLIALLQSKLKEHRWKPGHYLVALRLDGNSQAPINSFIEESKQKLQRQGFGCTVYTEDWMRQK